MEARIQFDGLSPLDDAACSPFWLFSWISIASRTKPDSISTKESHTITHESLFSPELPFCSLSQLLPKTPPHLVIQKIASFRSPRLVTWSIAPAFYRFLRNQPEERVEFASVEILQHLPCIDCLSGFRLRNTSAQQLAIAVHLGGGDLLGFVGELPHFGDLLRAWRGALGLDRDKADFLMRLVNSVTISVAFSRWFKVSRRSRKNSITSTHPRISAFAGE